MTRALRPWIPALIWAAAIFVMSSLPGSAYPQTNLWNADKFVHIALYGLMGGLCARGLAQGSPLLGWRRLLLLAALLATLYGVTDELHQAFVPGRNSDWRDVVADGLGSLIGAGIVAAVIATRRRGALR